MLDSLDAKLYQKAKSLFNSPLSRHYPKISSIFSHYQSTRNGSSGGRSFRVLGSRSVGFGGSTRKRTTQWVMPWGESVPQGDWGFAGQGSQVLRRGQRSLPWYDGEVLRVPYSLQASPIQTPLTLPGILRFYLFIFSLSKMQRKFLLECI